MNETTPPSETQTGGAESAPAESGGQTKSDTKQSEGTDAPPSGDAQPTEGTAPKRRRRGKRGGKRHRKKTTASGTTTTAAAAAAARPDEARETAGEPAAAAPRPRPPRASSRAPAKRAPVRPAEPAPAEPAAAEPAPAEAVTTEAETPTRGPSEAAAPEQEQSAQAEGTAPRKRRRRGGRGRGGKKKPATTDAATEAPAASAPAEKAEPKPASTRLAARAQRRQQRPRRPRPKLSEEQARQLRGEDMVMLIHEHDDRTQIAILEKGVLIEHFVARKGARTTMAGNVYLGKVQNVLPGMEAAFIDFGRGRNGVLYAGEVNYSQEDLEGDQSPRIEHVLKNGQKLMVQVTKDPIGNKGARLTTQISLAGRYMVLAPEQQLTGISRRLAENERTRLRQFLREMRPSGHGVIVRTAAEGVSRDALERDLAHLLTTWEKIQKASKRAKAPHQLYGEPDLVTRVIRDEFSDDFTTLVVDTRELYDSMRSYLEDSAPDLLPKLQLHEGALPLFEEWRVSEQLHKALERKVWLPSGGSIVIDRTEALTVIDVNTGKFTGKGSTLEDTVFANNLEAAEEIARQLRLRDIGGIIVMDFIDMIDPKNQKELLRTLKRALSKDRTRSQVFDVSNLGLVEMTRKKVSEGLLEAFSEPCPNCEGRGIVLTHEIE